MTCFSQHTGGTASSILIVLDCASRDPVLVEIVVVGIFIFLTESVVSFKQTV